MSSCSCRELKAGVHSRVFCSRNCQKVFALSIGPKWFHGECEHCKTPVSRRASRLEGRVLCSRQCHNDFKLGKPLRHGGQFAKGQSPWNKGLTRLTSEPMARVAAAKDGPGNPNYINGQSIGRSNRSPEYRIWRESVFTRDHYQCQSCDAPRGGYLEAHHVRAWATHPELRYDVDNGLTLCRQCHLDTRKRQPAHLDIAA